MSLFTKIIPLSLLVIKIALAADEKLLGSTAPSLGVINFPELSLQVGQQRHGQIKAPCGGFGGDFVSIYSGLTPIDIYRLNSDEYRMGLLSPILFGIGTFIPLALVYPGGPQSDFVSKHYWAFLIPGYLMNPEIRVGIIRPIKVYSGYSYNLVQQKKVRGIFSLNAGTIIKTWNRLPELKMGVERVYFQQQEIDNLLLGLTFRL
jgi:hypothetical protein